MQPCLQASATIITRLFPYLQLTFEHGQILFFALVIEVNDREKSKYWTVSWIDRHWLHLLYCLYCFQNIQNCITYWTDDVAINDNILLFMYFRLQLGGIISIVTLFLKWGLHKRTDFICNWFDAAAFRGRRWWPRSYKDLNSRLKFGHYNIKRELWADMALKLNCHFRDLLCPDKEAYFLVDHLSRCIQESKGQWGTKEGTYSFGVSCCFSCCGRDITCHC